MVNKEIVWKRIEKAREYLDFLHEIKLDYSREEFKKDKKAHGSTERFLHLCIEVFMDLGNHIIADQRLGKVEFYSDIPKLLFQHGYLDEELKDLFMKIIGFRNILVHDYIKVDLDIVYDVVQNNLHDLEKLLQKFAEVL